jgi:hypothetical protein
VPADHDDFAEFYQAAGRPGQLGPGHPVVGGRPLWSNPSGERVISFCDEHGELYDHGHLSRITLHPPMYGLNFGAVFAW